MLTFWITAIALTAAGCMAVLVPVGRSRSKSGKGKDFDIEVYRDQLAEIDADAARGLIGDSEAAEARAEIGRRILKANTADENTGARSALTGKWLATAAIALIPLLSWGIYSLTGSPNLPGQPLQARLEKNPAESTIEELIARAERHLSQNPDDGRGWDVIAPIYLRVGRYQDAVQAYANAIRIGGSDARRQSGLGEAVTAANDGAVTPEAAVAFDAALLLEPGNEKARFFKAMASAQKGRGQEALVAWQALIDDASQQSPWRQASVNAIETLRAQMAGSATSEKPGPDAEDIAAAEQMSVQERGEMIETMVAGLAARLEENPLDAEGWQRLVRSYVVLGKTDEAKAALRKGRKALEGESGAAQALVEFAATLGITETD